MVVTMDEWGQEHTHQIFHLPIETHEFVFLILQSESPPNGEQQFPIEGWNPEHFES